MYMHKEGAVFEKNEYLTPSRHSYHHVDINPECYKLLGGKASVFTVSPLGFPVLVT